jgi:hypothetical protein
MTPQLLFIDYRPGALRKYVKKTHFQTSGGIPMESAISENLHTILNMLGLYNGVISSWPSLPEESGDKTLLVPHVISYNSVIEECIRKKKKNFS